MWANTMVWQCLRMSVLPTESCKPTSEVPPKSDVGPVVEVGTNKESFDLGGRKKI